MKIRRAQAHESKHFSREAFQKKLAYVVEENPIRYIEFEIFDIYKARITPFDEKWGTSLIDVFRFHNGFVTLFYDCFGNLIKTFPNVELFQINPQELGVTQWLVSEKKLADLNQWLATPEDVIVPVFPYKNRWIALDGHTRLKAAIHWEMPYVYAYKEAGDGLSKAFYNSAMRRDIVTVEDLEVVDAKRYQRDWEEMCDQFIATYKAKQQLREKALEERKLINQDTYDGYNEKLIERLAQFLSTHHVHRIGVFYPLDKEVDLRSFDVSYETYYPLIEEEDIQFAPYSEHFKKGPLNTQVPNTEKRLLGTLDAVIVPGLYFDAQGYRLGYGKGYYDHFLNDYKGLKIGVCFSSFFVTSLPKEAHDQAVDFVITNTQTIEVRTCTQR